MAVGISPTTFKSMIRRGDLERILPAVYRMRGTPSTWRQQVAAAVLWGGEGAVASHATAAKLWRFPVVSERIHITTPHRRVAPRPGLDVHRGSAGAVVIDRIRVTNASRTLLDVAASVSPDVLEELIDDAVTRRIASPASLEWELKITGGQGRRGSKPFERAIAHLHEGHAESVLETRVLRVLIKAGLPMPVRQYDISDQGFSARIDLAYPEVKLAIEVDGFRYHSGRRAFDADRRRDAHLRALGWTVIRVTREMLVDPAPFLRAIEAALANTLM